VRVGPQQLDKAISELHRDRRGTRLNEVIKRVTPINVRRRLLAGLHDIEAFVDDIRTVARDVVL
jgi:hypothetical protein